MTQHAALTLERWSELSRDQQILSIAAAVYLEPDEAQHRALFRALLRLTPASAKQLPFLTAEPRP
jgi:hypothetical protein